MKKSLIKEVMSSLIGHYWCWILSILLALACPARVADNLFRYLVSEHQNTCSVDMSCPDIEENNTLGSYCCGRCNCESDCVKYGSCCPGVYDSLEHAYNSTAHNRYGCVNPQYKRLGETKVNSVIDIWMVVKCDPTASNATVVRLCEHPGINDDITTIAPVTHLISQENYRNKYCAYCNGVNTMENLITWTFSIANDKYISLPDKKFLEKLRQGNGNVIFEPPNYVRYRTCNIPSYTITSCNETKLWARYDVDIDRACRSYTDPFNYTYKNYFCYLCNIAELPSPNLWNCVVPPARGDFITVPSFFAILDISAVEGTDKEIGLLNCNSTQFKDEIMNACHDVKCYYGRRLYSGQCLPDMKLVGNDTCATVFIKLTRNSHWTNINKNDRKLQKNILSIFTERAGYPNLVHTSLIFYHTDRFDSIDYIVIFLVVSSSNFERIKAFYDYFDSVMDMQNETISVVLSSNAIVKFHLEVTSYDIIFTTHSAKIEVQSKSDTSITQLIAPLQSYDMDMCHGSNFTAVNKLFKCPFIQLNNSKMSLKEENSSLLIKMEALGNYVKLFSKWEYELIEDTFFICLEDIQRVHNALSESDSSTKIRDPLDPKPIISLICVCVSVVSLLVTIITHVSYPALQSQPGVNNLILCIFLLLAQSFYQFGSGLTSLPDLVCSLIGIVCHFLWLSALFSMTMCCIRMFLIFNRHAQLTPRFTVSQTSKNVIFVTCASVLFIVVNISVSLISSDGISVGYGGRLCYISSSLMQLITFVIPAAVALTINMILFSYVVHRIKNVGASSVRLNKERNYLMVYVRLSTLTGLTWIFGFLELIFNTEVLEYLFIIFNAGQGVFIMVAFVLNQRVLALICTKSEPTSSTSPGTEETTRSSPKEQ